MELGPHLAQCGYRAEAYLHAKFHLDPSNRLATMPLTLQTGQDNGPTALGEPFYKRSPKNSCNCRLVLKSHAKVLYSLSSVVLKNQVTH